MQAVVAEVFTLLVLLELVALAVAVTVVLLLGQTVLLIWVAAEAVWVVKEQVLATVAQELLLLVTLVHKQQLVEL
jgi:hypothetical protein